jgi:hypothetical protein
MITHEPASPTASHRTATTSQRTTGLFAAVVVGLLSLAFWALVTACEGEVMEAGPLLVHTDCSGFVEGGE